MNKYLKLARRQHEERRQKRMCMDKKAFNIREAATHKSQGVYACPYCGKWHRSTQLARLVRFVRRGF